MQIKKFIDLPNGKGWPACKADSLDISPPYGPLQPVTAVVLPFFILCSKGEHEYMSS
jgi:hypothetical protein